MFKILLSNEPGIAGFAIFGLVTFLALFIGIVVWAIFGKHSYMEKMGKLPLDEKAAID